MLFLIDNHVVPFKTNSFSLLNIGCGKNCAVLVFYFDGLEYFKDVVRNIPNQILSFVILFDVCKFGKVIHDTRTCSVLWQIPQYDAYPFVFSEATRIVSQPKFNRLLGLVKNRITLGPQYFIYVLKRSWVLKLN